MQVYRKWAGKLEALYRSRIDFKDVGTHNYWKLGDWAWFLEAHGLLGGDEALTRADANACYYLSKFETVHSGGGGREGV